QAGTAMLERRIHRPIALDGAQRLCRAANRAHGQLDAVLPDVRGPGGVDGLPMADEQPLVPLPHDDARTPQRLLQLIREPVGCEIGGDHAVRPRINAARFGASLSAWLPVRGPPTRLRPGCPMQQYGREGAPALP